MLCPPSEVKKTMSFLFLNFESYTNYLIEDENRLMFTLSRPEDGGHPALVPACLLQLHSFSLQYASN